MPARIARGEHAKSVIDSSIRKALAATCGKTRRAYLHLLWNVQGRSELLRPRKFPGRTDAAWVDTILKGLLALTLDRREWLRPVEAWSPKGSNPIPLFSSLAHHLFASYPVPPVLLSAWFHGDGWEGRRQRQWFKKAGQGESLRKLRLPLELTRRMVHEFVHAPAHFPIGFALRWAQVRGLGGKDELASAVAATRLSRQFAGNEFWESAIHFFINHAKLELHQIGSVVEYLHDLRFAQRCVIVGEDTEVQVDAPQPDLSLKGWTVASLLRRVEEWKAQRRPKAPERTLIEWARSTIGEYRTQDEQGQTWTIRELLNSDELAAEGKAMDHCVATYTDWCSKRLTTIWSMGIETAEGRQRVVTVEVNPASREVVQASAKSNADPDKISLRMLAEWARQEGLKLQE
jgi:hypothetical protein